MDALPSMWRVELLHPKLVHFPIALLAVGTLLFVAGLWLGQRPRWAYLLPAARTLLVFGVVGAWAAIWSGNLADAVVGRDLCDPLVLEQHERLSYGMTLLFSAGVLLDWIVLRLQPVRLAAWRSVLVAIYIAGTGLLFYIGHLGGQLVYQQAAAVHVPSEDCREFE